MTTRPEPSTEPDWSRVKEMFEAALQRPPDERASFLRDACGRDEALHREVATLVAAHDEAGGFLETPAATEAVRVGRRYGPYRVVAEIGRGGMGTVYRAVREDDAFHKEVALKLVRGAAGGDTGRFRRERQILARLQHPNIASLYDGGTSEEGQPYLVMELVEGESLDRYCATRAVGVRERIGLFRTVCAAVHHAHQALVVHRDLKPGNILVTRDGVPKLLDFGIAKLLASEDAGERAPTATMLPLLTPEFASPEQVRGESITTASDVYSLGVVLYELLTGRRPYTIETRALEEVARVVCQVEPTRPSLAVQGDAPPATARQLAGDLDTIVLKCLQKDPARRYRSALEVSDDLQRHLEGRPLLARPDTLRYRSAKFVRRHRLGVGAAAVAALGLVGGTVLAWREARIAETNRQRAERRFQDVRKLAGSLLFDLHDEIVNLPGSLKARQALVTKAEEYLAVLSREVEGDRDLQRELAAAYERLGDVQGGPRTANAGDSNAALRSYEKARALREVLGRARDAETRDVEALAFVQFALGALHRSRVELEAAEAAFSDAARLVEPLIGSERATEDLRVRLAGIYQRLSEVQARQGKVEEADASAARAVSFGEAYVRDHASDVDGRINLAAAYYAHAERLGARNELRRALARLAEARAIQQALRTEQPLNTHHARSLAYTINAEGSYHDRLGEDREAVRSYEQGVALAEEMARADPRDQYAQIAVAIANRSLGAALVAVEGPAAGMPRLRSARSVIEEVIRGDPGNGFAREERLAIDYYLGSALLASKTAAAHAEGCQALVRTLAGWELAEAAGRLSSDAKAVLAGVREMVGGCTS
jgi:eukaryotic-like serine/threonine-protein kinase